MIDLDIFAYFEFAVVDILVATSDAAAVGSLTNESGSPGAAAAFFHTVIVVGINTFSRCTVTAFFAPRATITLLCHCKW